MIIEKNLHTTKEAFFDFLIEAIIQDVKTSNGKDITEKDIKEGYKYTKGIKNKKKSLGHATIKAYEKPVRYCLKVKSDSGITTLDYLIKSIDENNIKVVYKEEFVNSDGKVTNGFFYQRGLKKRINAQFKQIQKYLDSK